MSSGVLRQAEAVVWLARRRPSRVWLHALLFAATAATTLVTGSELAASFAQQQPPFSSGSVLMQFGQLAQVDRLRQGAPFALSLLTILLAHEMGHYVACQYYRVRASLPYFLPSPLLLGTFGAFIRIRSPIYSRQALFDIGVAGPIAGFVVLVPLLALGLCWSTVVPGIGARGDLLFGTPYLLQGLEAFLFPGIPFTDINLHPVARAAWIGLFATALNLLPVGQLDGGHLLYAVTGKWQNRLSRGFLVMLLLLALKNQYVYWAVWAVALFVLGTRHFLIMDERPLGRGRLYLGAAAVLIFALSFMQVPLAENGQP